MDSPFVQQPQFVDSVFHPSDFSPASERAFAHALAISMLCNTKLTILHADASRDDWEHFPAVRTTLKRWGLLDENSSEAGVVNEVAMRVKKVSMRKDDPLQATLEYLDQHPMDLIVLATEGRDGLPRWLRPSVAERIALKSHIMTLFVPNHARGFVSYEDGRITLQRILIPIDFHPSPLPAIGYAAKLAEITEEDRDIVLFHVGDVSGLSDLRVPKNPRTYWITMTQKGDVVNAILKAAEQYSVNAIVMATAGHDGFLDALRGSITEQVVRHASCPVLAIPST